MTLYIIYRSWTCLNDIPDEMLCYKRTVEMVALCVTFIQVLGKFNYRL